MTCSTCKNWHPKANPAMEKHFMATCLLGPVWKFTPPHATCRDHQLAKPEVVEQRKVWLAREVA